MGREREVEMEIITSSNTIYERTMYIVQFCSQSA